MEFEERAEEVLETMWVLTEEDKRTAVALSDLPGNGEAPVKQLLEAGCIALVDGGVKLTELGRPAARKVVRRHRLAERLLVDVLGAGEKMHERACKFEHLLDEGLDDSICTLLGHPKVCPHGKPIPEGRCCRQKETQGQRVVSALSGLTPGHGGKVAYIHSTEPDQLQKLTAMGILPGEPISLLQDFPSYVFQIGRTQFAVDREIAGTIYVRLVEPETPDAGEPGKPRGHRLLPARRR
jgi:DtxR family transcriptional regulator, Mn-dependent transcriptional regulator